MFTFKTYRSSCFQGPELVDQIEEVCKTLKWEKKRGSTSSLEYSIKPNFLSFGCTVLFDVLGPNINMEIKSNNELTIADSGNGEMLLRDFIISFQKLELSKSSK